MPFETDAVDFKGPPLDCNVRSRIMGLGCSSVTLKDELMGDDDFVYRVVGSWADPKKADMTESYSGPRNSDNLRGPQVLQWVLDENTYSDVQGASDESSRQGSARSRCRVLGGPFRIQVCEGPTAVSPRREGKIPSRPLTTHTNICM